jgi:fructose-1-phosphate kinase PfkB-like protein
MLLALIPSLQDQELQWCWSGKETESDEQAEEAARDILSQGIRSVLVKRGTQGSMMIDRDGNVTKQPICRADKVGSYAAWSSAMLSVRGRLFSQCLGAQGKSGPLLCRW